MIGFAALRLMELEVGELTVAAYGKRSLPVIFARRGRTLLVVDRPSPRGTVARLNLCRDGKIQDCRIGFAFARTRGEVALRLLVTGLGGATEMPTARGHALLLHGSMARPRRLPFVEIPALDTLRRCDAAQPGPSAAIDGLLVLWGGRGGGEG